MKLKHYSKITTFFKVSGLVGKISGALNICFIDVNASYEVNSSFIT